jgi:uncharacterized protein YxeA
VIKKIIISVLLLATIGVGTGVYMWYKPHQKVENQLAIAVSADKLATDYTANEKAADAAYLNKAIQVKGTVKETETNADGGLMVVLRTSDAMIDIQCTMRDIGVQVAPDTELTLVGFCSGSGITGVSLTDCVLKK